MKKLITLLSASLLALACASSDSFESAAVDAGTESLGQAEEPLMSSRLGAHQYGFKPGNEGACQWGVSNQTCIVANRKAVRFYIQGGTSSERQNVRFIAGSWYQNMVALGLDQSINGWLWSETENLSDPDLTLVIALEPGTTGACPGLNNKTVSLSCFTGTRTSLVESAGTFGNYERWVASPVLHIDYSEIQALPLTSTQKSFVLTQAVYSGLLRFVGTGLVTVGDFRCNKADVITSTGCTLRAQQACAANSYGDVGNQTDWWVHNSDCGQ